MTFNCEPYPYADMYFKGNERIEYYGILKRKEYINNI